MRVKKEIWSDLGSCVVNDDLQGIKRGHSFSLDFKSWQVRARRSSLRLQRQMYSQSAVIITLQFSQNGQRL